MHRRPGVRELPQPLLQRLILNGRYLVIFKDDTRLFALAGGCGTGTANGTGTVGGAPSTSHQGATTATCRTAAYRNASMAMTTSGAARTAGPEDDHAMGLIAPLH
jgi:hypothetical protein